MKGDLLDRIDALLVEAEGAIDLLFKSAVDRLFANPAELSDAEIDAVFVDERHGEFPYRNGFTTEAYAMGFFALIADIDMRNDQFGTWRTVGPEYLPETIRCEWCDDAIYRDSLGVWLSWADDGECCTDDEGNERTHVPGERREMEI